MAEKTFYGAIAGMTGEYVCKGYSMLRGETVSVGSMEGSDIRIEAAEERIICQISYDEEMQEYHVHPMEMRAVFLRSGQPLGAHRVYCLPRGTEIMIIDPGSRFRLA